LRLYQKIIAIDLGVCQLGVFKVEKRENKNATQQNVCAMVAGRQGIKYIYPTTFSHADSGGFEMPPLRKHKRWQQLGLVDRFVQIVKVF
jgi:hypothetical protein